MLRIDESKKAKAKKQAGFVVTAELLLITTILGLGLITGYTKVRDQVLAELSDTGSAIGAINQSYELQGTQWGSGNANVANVSGFSFTDATDHSTPATVGGDTETIEYNGIPAATSTTISGLGEEGIK
jgi:hypothetical protein